MDRPQGPAVIHAMTMTEQYRHLLAEGWSPRRRPTEYGQTGLRSATRWSKSWQTRPNRATTSTNSVVGVVGDRRWGPPRHRSNRSGSIPSRSGICCFGPPSTESACRRPSEKRCATTCGPVDPIPSSPNGIRTRVATLRGCQRTSRLPAETGSEQGVRCSVVGADSRCFSASRGISRNRCGTGSKLLAPFAAPSPFPTTWSPTPDRGPAPSPPTKPRCPASTHPPALHRPEGTCARSGQGSLPQSRPPA